MTTLRSEKENAGLTPEAEAGAPDSGCRHIHPRTVPGVERSAAAVPFTGIQRRWRYRVRGVRYRRRGQRRSKCRPTASTRCSGKRLRYGIAYGYFVVQVTTAAEHRAL